MAKDDRTTVKSVKVDTKLSITHREETNSAMGSWSGYIYQGLCGILVVLRMLRANVAVYKDYSLQLDGYEDFSILDEQGKIVSMHQCKSDKNRTNYDEEFKKTKAKVDGLAAQGILQNPANSPCYFHCNRQGKYIYFVTQYDSDVDALYKMSSGQLVALMMALLLSLNKLYSESKFLAIDDPVQTIDDINVWGFVETLRHEFRDYQFLFSTHELSYGSFLRYKLSNMGIAAKYVDMMEARR